MNIKVKYDGKWPNLCRGNLIITIEDSEIINGDNTWTFPEYCMTSNGTCNISEITSGSWTIDSWPENFPEILKLHVEKAVNDQIEWGCCGGCR